MFKRVGIFLLLFILVCLCTSALAAPDDVLLFTRDETATRNPTVEAAVPVGDTLYMLLRMYEEADSAWVYRMFRYTLGQDAEAEMICDNIFYTRSYPNLGSAIASQQEGMSPEEGFGYLFGDGESLYGFNNLTGSMAALTFADGAMHREEVCTVDMQALLIAEDDYSYMVDIMSPVLMDGHLYFAFTDWRTSEPAYSLFDINLADGSVRTQALERQLNDLTVYKDGTLLGYAPSRMDRDTGTRLPSCLVAVHLADGTLTPVQDLSDDLRLDRMVYDPAADTLYYSSPSILWAMPALSQPQQVAYTNQGYASGLAVLGKGYAAVWDSDGLEIRNLDPAYLPTKTLTIVNTSRDAAAQQFTRENPDVPLIYPQDFYSLETLGTAMISGETAIDLVALDVDGGFDAMLEKGYCADLSSSQVLMDFVQGLYPAVQKEIMKDGKLYAIPMSISSSVLCYNVDKLEEVGLTQEDVPTNLVDLCAFITRWNNEWMDDENKANVMPICTLSSNRQIVFDMMLNGYIDYYDATGQTLDFDTPLFNQLLTALDNMAADNLDRPAVMSDMEYDEFYQLYSGLFLEDSLLSSVSTGREYLLGPLALNDELDYKVGAYLQVMFVNPKCENMPEALRLLECYVQNISPYSMIPLSPDANDPLPNPNYEQTVQNLQENLADLQAQLAGVDPAQKRDLEDSIAYYEQRLANQEDLRWNISPETITRYRELIGDHVYIRHSNVLYSAGDDTYAQLQSLHNRYIQNQITREQYIKELNQKARMIVLEDQ